MFNIDYNLVLSIFTKDRRPSLVEKPKPFLFDTCRGMRGLYTPMPSPCTPLFPSIDSNVTYPVYTDMLIISSTTYGHVIWTWSQNILTL